MSDSKTLLDFLTTRYPEQHEYPKADRKRIKIALELIGSGHRVLDVGAFEGQISQAIASRGNAVTALDASEPALAGAKARGLKTLHADLTQSWPLGDATFNVVFAGEILEHIIDTDFFLSECRRVLEDDGRLIVTTPNLASLGRRVMLLFGKNPYLDTALRDEQAGHVRFFVMESLRTLLEDNQFTILRSRGDIVLVSRNGIGVPGSLPFLRPFAKSLIVEAKK